MAPVVYENHCAAATRPVRGECPEQFARHGITLQETLYDLRQLYMSEAAKGDPELLRQFVPPRPMPGQSSLRTKPTISQAVDIQVLDAARLLFGAAVDLKVLREQKLPQGRRGCVECHNLKPADVPIANLSSLAALEIERRCMTPVWQRHALFNHRYHRALNCVECHARPRHQKRTVINRSCLESIRV